MANEKKSNIQFLKEIIKEFEIVDSVKAAEAEEFLNAIAEEISKKEKVIKELQEEIIGMETDGFNPDDRLFVGLDTFEYRLENGNLLVQQRVDDFVKSLRKEFCVSETSF